MNRAFTILQTVLTGVLFLAFSHEFTQSFHYAKTIIFLLLGTLSFFQLCFLRKVSVPTGPISWAFLAILTAATISLFSSHATLNSLPHYMIFVSSFFILISLCNQTEKSRNTLYVSIFIIALIESIIAYLQFASIKLPSPLTLSSSDNRIIGTFGNSEFMATFLAVAGFIGLHLLKTYTHHKKTLIAGLLIIAPALVLTMNKGSILFIAGWGLYHLTRRKLLVSAIILSSILLSLFLFGSSVKGRLLLWISSINIFKDHLIAGVGLRQIGHHYLESVASVLNSNSILGSVLEKHTANVLDAHNFILNWAAEAGVAGLISASALVICCLKLKSINKPFLHTALLFLLFKSMYTVMHNSTTSLMLFLIVVSALIPLKVYALPLRMKTAILASGTLFLIGCFMTFRVISSDYWYSKSMMAIAQANIDTAIIYGHKSLETNPQNSDAHLACGHSYFLKKEKKNMSKHLDQSIKLFKSMNSLKISAHMYFYSGMHEKAEKLYSEIVEYYPHHLTSLSKLAQIYFLDRDYVQAHSYASLVLETEPRVKNESDFGNRRTCAEIINKTGPLLYGERK
ncbi:MAG: O-antigen ligase family protein [Fibrobacterota bacterium]